MSIEAVNFGNQQQKQQKSGVSVPAWMLGGAAIGGSGAYFTKYGKTPLKLEGLTADEFTKALPKEGLTETEKANAKKVEDYLTKNKTEEVKPEVKADAKPEAKPKTEVKPEAKPEAKGKVVSQSTVTDRKIDDIFGKNTELEPKEYLNKKYGYQYSTTADLEADITKLKHELTGQPVKGKGNVSAANLGSESKAAKSTVSNAENVKRLSLEYDKINNQVAEAETKLNEYKADAKLRGKNIDQKVLDNRQKGIDELKKQQTAVKEKADKFGKRFDPETLMNENATKARDAAFEKNLTSTIQNAQKEGGRAYVAGSRAEKSAIKIVQDQARSEALKTAKEAGKATKEIEAAGEKAAKAVTAKNPKVKAAVVAAQTAELEKIGREQASKYLTNTTKDMIKTAKHTEAKVNKKIVRHNAQISEMEADLATIRDAKKAGTKITKETASGIIETSSKKVAAGLKAAVGEAKAAIPENITKAFGEFSLKKISWGKVGIGAAIGAAVLGLGAAMLGGSKKPEATEA